MGPTTTGVPNLMAPAFSVAMRSIVSPNIRVWSSPIGAMMGMGMRMENGDGNENEDGDGDRDGEW